MPLEAARELFRLAGPARTPRRPERTRGPDGSPEVSCDQRPGFGFLCRPGLVDLEAHRWMGRSVSALEWAYAEDGPFDTAFYRHLARLEAAGLVREEDRGWTVRNAAGDATPPTSRRTCRRASGTSSAGSNAPARGGNTSHSRMAAPIPGYFYYFETDHAGRRWDVWAKYSILAEETIWIEALDVSPIAEP